MSKFLAVVGPTASGKSSLSLEIASRLGQLGMPCEIVNADSMQFYKGMDIGTAKLPQSQRRNIAHHLLDWLEVVDESTAAQYQAKARESIEEIQSRGALPILVGGSMLYLAAVLNTFEFPARDSELRAQLESDLEAQGSEVLHARLEQLDEGAASRVDPKNGRRVVRALEIVIATGKPFAAALPEKFDSWQRSLQIGLNSDRADLVERIASRSSQMFEAGLVEEVENLIPHGIREGKTSSRAIGYAQALNVMDGRATVAQAVEETSALSARYARRQMSWFRRDTRINWFDYQDENHVERAFQLALSFADTDSQ